MSWCSEKCVVLRNGDFITVCAFPYIFAFTTDSMEIRLIINGNLVQTMVLPKLALICSKVTTAPQSSCVNAISFYLLKRRSYLPIEKKNIFGVDIYNLSNEYNASFPFNYISLRSKCLP
jgi:hypothetical protein